MRDQVLTLGAYGDERALDDPFPFPHAVHD